MAAVWLAASLCSGPPAAQPVPVREGTLAGQPAGGPASDVPEAAGSGARASQLPADEGDAASGAHDERGIHVSSLRSELPVEESAAQLLEDYRDQGGCALVQAGWLDLLGNVWSCTVQGSTWTDLCVVRGVDDGTSEVRVVRMEGEAWEGLEGGMAPG